MDLGLQGKIVCVTASSHGIGHSIAETFLSEGAVVILNGRQPGRLKEAAAKLAENYGDSVVYAFTGDMTNQEDISGFRKYIQKNFGRLDILVSNLGSGKPTAGGRLASAEWEHMIKVNLFSAVRLIDSMTELLEHGENSNIVLISSITAWERSGAPFAYAAAKAGILSLANNLSGEYASKRIRVNTVVPGNVYFPGGRWEEIRNTDPKGTDQMIQETVPLGRFGKPSEIAAAVAFLASEKSAFTTGSTLVVDGGQRKEI